MIELSFTYSEEELGWASPWLELEGDTYMEGSLKDKGRICIKKKNETNGTSPKIHISPYIWDFELRFRGESEGKFVQIITSEEPKYIRYANIQERHPSGS